MKLFTLFAALMVLACSPQEKVPRPNIDSGPVDDQCGDSSPGCPKDSLVVDSTQASSVKGWPIFRQASYGAAVAVDSSTYTINYSVSNPLGPVDTVQVWLRRDSALTVPKVSTSKYFRTLKGAAVFKVVKIYNAKATYRVCVRVRSNTLKSNDLCQVWITNYTKATPPPVVDTVKVDSSLAILKLDVKPDNPTVETGQQIQFCAYVVFQTGKVALRTQDKGIPQCDEMYKGYTLVQRDLTLRQQQAADSVCVQWKVTGGSIVAETCGPPNPLVGHPV